MSKQDILDFEAEHGQIVEGAFVAFRSDWSKRWPDQDAMRNLDENGVHKVQDGAVKPWILDS